MKTKASKTKPPKQRNPIARVLSHGLFRQQIVPSGKVYHRRNGKASLRSNTET